MFHEYYDYNRYPGWGLLRLFVFIFSKFYYTISALKNATISINPFGVYSNVKISFSCK